MIIKYTNLEVPHGNTNVWKYMNLEKFLDLIIHKKLYFCNAQLMSDKKDGIIPLSTQNDRINDLLSKGMTKHQAKNSVNNELEIHRKLKSSTFLNCWSIHQDESYALWKIYLGGSKSGVAIKTTISRLKKAFNDVNNYNDHIAIGKVKYRNHIELSSFNFSDVITTKSTYYSYEHELRLFNSDFNQNTLSPEENDLFLYGKRIPVDIHTLISEIYISPFSNRWFIDVLKEVIEKIDISLIEKIKISQIEDI